MDMTKKTAKPTPKKAAKVDYEPNKMSLAVATLAVVTLVLFTFITVL